MLLAARTKKYEEVQRKTEGITLFLVNVKEATDRGEIEARMIDTVINSQTYELFINGLKVPEHQIVGEQGKGFYYLLEVLNQEGVLIASECIGDAKWFLKRSIDHAVTGRVFERPIGQNQGVRFPIASCFKLLGAENIAWHAAQY